MRAVMLCGQKIVDRDKRLYNLWVVMDRIAFIRGI